MSLKGIFQKEIGAIVSAKPLSGGDINSVFYIESASGEYVVKTNDYCDDGFFSGEAAGLKALRRCGLPVPEVIAVQEKGILMEYLPPGTAQPEKAGRYLAMLHSRECAEFGWEADNYIGRLPQLNTISKTWSEFLWSNRIEYQLEFYSRRNNTEGEKNLWKTLRLRLDQILPGEVKPSLLHGDLWSGNLYYTEDGPYFIDPAVYWGDRYMELAMTELFGPFDKRFYDAYSEVMPIESQYQEVKNLYQIYPLLVHANHFGGSYYEGALRKAKSYL